MGAHKVALHVIERLRSKETDIVVNSYLHSFALQSLGLCLNLEKRDLLLRRQFEMCCADGMVNAFILKHLTKKCYTGTSVRCRGSSHTSKQEARRLHNSTNDLPVVRHGCLVDGITHSVTDFVSTPAVVSTLSTLATVTSLTTECLYPC